MNGRTSTKSDLRLFLRNHKDYLEHLTHSPDTVTKHMARYILMEFERKCTMCHKTKPEEQFSIIINSRNKRKCLKARCKSCECKVSKAYYQGHKQDIKVKAVRKQKQN